MIRKSTISWKGSGKDGKGTVTTQSGVLKDTQYSWQARFEEGIGTNPEELLAAAHAGCFTMKLSFVLASKNFISESIDTVCSVTVDNGEITLSHLEVTAKVPGITMEQFQACALEAKDGCVVSKLFNTLKTMQATLVD
jgi:osmotically inducible protein OsmC